MSLYPPEGAHWWSPQDHMAVVNVMRRLKPKRVLEFGPGTSTLALIEGGAWRIECCEDDAHWHGVWLQRLSRYPQVRMHAFKMADPITIPALDEERFDLALVDGPRDTVQRFEVIRYALRHCDQVLVALESIGSDCLTLFCLDLIARKRIKSMDLFQTGPLAGSFGLLTP